MKRRPEENYFIFSFLKKRKKAHTERKKRAFGLAMCFLSYFTLDKFNLRSNIKEKQ